MVGDRDACVVPSPDDLDIVACIHVDEKVLAWDDGSWYATVTAWHGILEPAVGDVDAILAAPQFEVVGLAFGIVQMHRQLPVEQTGAVGINL